MDFRNLSPGQEEVLQRIWKTLEYLEVSRTWALEDRLRVEQCRNIGLLMAEFRKAATRSKESDGDNVRQN